LADRAPEVLHVVASINRRTGGPAVSVPGLAAALRRCGIPAEIAAMDLPRTGAVVRAPAVPVHLVRPGRVALVLRGFSFDFHRRMRLLGRRRWALIHNHGLWMGPNVEARRLAQRLGVPLIISPRGMLESWSLQHHAARKRLAWRLFEHANLRAAHAFHATSEQEADSIRAVGLRQPIAVIPNGVTIPRPITAAEREQFARQFPALRDRRVLLFLSRLHPKKGLDQLLRVWQRLSPKHPGWCLVIAGQAAPDIEGIYESQTRDLGLGDSVLFTGHLDGACKRAALARAELFVLPSHSENFGMAIAEALAAGCPAIATRATPWRALERESAGWWIDNDTSSLEAALGHALALPCEDLAARGARGRAHVRRDLSWLSVAERMAAFYQALLGHAEFPSFVRRD
jgi:glycosyltransferase involved in cell wall biosynthesis